MKVEPSNESFDNSDLNHLYLFFYLIPILGFFPSLWTLYRGARGLGLETRESWGSKGDLGSHASAGVEEFEQSGVTWGLGDNVNMDSSFSLSPHLPLTKSSSSPQPLASSPSLAISRLSVTLAFAWLLGYLLLNIGAETSEFLTLRLLVLNSLLTSGYFLVSIWLMVRLASGSSVRLPGFSSLAERVFGKHLS